MDSTNLNSLILSNARERVANEKGFKDWKSLDYMNQGAYVAQATEQAALLAMEELAGFLRWMFIHGYDLSESEKRYTQYLNEKKDADK